MFPGAHDTIIVNEAGEPIGWEPPTDPNDFWCDVCGCIHMGDCPVEPETDEDEVE